MTPSEIDASVHRQLGEIAATLHGLQDSFRRAEEAARRSEDKAAESRAVVHKRMDDLVDRVSEVQIGLTTAQEDIREMKPVTDDVRKWKLMGLGALGVVGLGGAALGISLAGAFQSFVHLVRSGM